METLRLRQFKTVVDLGGLRKASEILHISSGGLSKSLKVLENDLGVELFSIQGRGLELTEEGRGLYERVPLILKAIDDLKDLHKPNSISGKMIRLVSFEVFTVHFLSRLIKSMPKDSNFEVREEVPGRMEGLIANGDSDFGISYFPVAHAGVDFVKVGKIRMGIFGLQKHWQDTAFDKLPFVAPIFPIQGMPSGVKGLDGWPDHTYNRLVRFRVELLQTAIELSLQGLAVVFLPDFVAKQTNLQLQVQFQLQELALPVGMKAIYRDIFLLYRKGRSEDGIMRSLAKGLRVLR